MLLKRAGHFHRTNKKSSRKEILGIIRLINYFRIWDSEVKLMIFSKIMGIVVVLQNGNISNKYSTTLCLMLRKTVQVMPPHIWHICKPQPTS